MSIQTVEIRAYSGPDLVTLQGTGRPAIVRLNVGPAGPAGPAGPNSVTSATTSDGTASLDILDLVASGTISTNEFEAPIFTSGDFSNIYTIGENSNILTIGENANILTNGDNAHIGTNGANAYIQSRSTFNLYNGTNTTTLSHNPTGDRAIAFPDASGTVALTSQLPDLSTAVLKSAYTPAHSILAQQSGTGSPTAVTLGNNTILGRKSGGGSNIAGLSASDARTVMGLGTLATVDGGTGVATALAVNTGSAGAFVVNGGTATDMTYAGNAAFTSTTRPTSAGTGTPAPTSLITLTDARDFLANPSSVILREDFVNLAVVSGQIGELGWSEFGTGTGQTITGPIIPSPNIGIRRLTSGNTATGNGKVIYLSRIIPIGSVNWEICWVAALVQTTDCDMIVGLTNDNAGIGITRFGGKSMGARYSSAVDTNFMFFSKNTDLDWAANDSNNFSVSSGVAVNTSYNTFRLRNVNGVYSASINGGSFVTITNTLTGITSNVMFPFFYIATRTTANKQLDVDYFSCIITGLSR